MNTRKRAMPYVVSWVMTGLVLTSCASPGKRTGIGAGAGAATGAVVGGVASGWKGAAIGAAVGAAAGAGIGNLLDRRAQELEEVADTKQTKDGLLVSLKNDLLFDTNSSILRPQAIDQLTQLGNILAKYPDDRLKIEGYTDNVGAESYNENLSQRRADSVKNVLVSRGVRPDQVLVLGRGETNPIATNQTAQGRATNRRVELHIEVPQARTG